MKHSSKNFIDLCIESVRSEFKTRTGRINFLGFVLLLAFIIALSLPSVLGNIAQNIIAEVRDRPKVSNPDAGLIRDLVIFSIVLFLICLYIIWVMEDKKTQRKK